MTIEVNLDLNVRNFSFHVIIKQIFTDLVINTQNYYLGMASYHLLPEGFSLNELVIPQ